MALIVTPTGRVLRGSVQPNGIPEVFAAQFSLSHLAWLITYPIAGWLGTNLGFAVTWTVLAILAIVGAVAARVLWPRRDAMGPQIEPPVGVAGDTSATSDTGIAAGTLAECQCTAAHVS